MINTVITNTASVNTMPANAADANLSVNTMPANAADANLSVNTMPANAAANLSANMEAANATAHAKVSSRIGLRLNRRTALILLAVIFCGGLLLRLASWYINKDNFKLYADDASYVAMSRQLVEDGIYGYVGGEMSGIRSGESNAAVTPGYPLLLAGAYAAAGNDPYRQITLVRLIQVLMSSACILLAFAAMRSLKAGYFAALTAAAVVACYPPFIESVNFLFTEPAACFTLMLWIFLQARAFCGQGIVPELGHGQGLKQSLEQRVGHVQSRISAHILSGIAFAIHIYVRPGGVILLPAAYLTAALASRAAKHFTAKENTHTAVQSAGPESARSAAGRSAEPESAQLAGKHSILAGFIAAIVAFAVMFTPWVIRNTVTLGEPIIFSQGISDPLLRGVYPNFEGLFEDIDGSVLSDNAAMKAHAWERVKKGFAEEPLKYLSWYTWGRVRTMFAKPWLYKHLLFNADMGYRHLPLAERVSFALHFAIMAAAIFGALYAPTCMIARKLKKKYARSRASDVLHIRKIHIFSIYIVIGVFLLMFIPVVPVNRYNFLFMPMLIIAGLLSLEVFANTVTSQRLQRARRKSPSSEPQIYSR